MVQRSLSRSGPDGEFATHNQFTPQLHGSKGDVGFVQTDLSYGASRPPVTGPARGRPGPGARPPGSRCGASCDGRSTKTEPVRVITSTFADATWHLLHGTCDPPPQAWAFSPWCARPLAGRPRPSPNIRHPASTAAASRPSASLMSFFSTVAAHAVRSPGPPVLRLLPHRSAQRQDSHPIPRLSPHRPFPLRTSCTIARSGEKIFRPNGRGFTADLKA
jgi:hypothetical protein